MTYLLRTCQPDGRSSRGRDFTYPLEVGAAVEAPDWDPADRCGGGLHGLRDGVGNGALLGWDADAVWVVLEAVPDDVVDINDMGAGGKSKCRRATVVHVGDRRSAAAWLDDHGCADKPVVGATRTAGDGGTATAGYRGTATVGHNGTASVGDDGTATAGHNGTATAGYHGTATAGHRGTASVGHYGTATAGHYGTATAGHRGTATVGDDGTATVGHRGTATAGGYGTATVGHNGTATAGDGGTATAGAGGTATAGYRGTATAGDDGTATVGHNGTATAGYHGTATAGAGGTATAGDRGTVQVRWWDGSRYRIATGYVGEGGIDPDIPYRCDDAGNLVQAEIRRDAR